MGGSYEIVGGQSNRIFQGGYFWSDRQNNLETIEYLPFGTHNWEIIEEYNWDLTKWRRLYIFLLGSSEIALLLILMTMNLGKGS